jgi:hypothetical protein
MGWGRRTWIPVPFIVLIRDYFSRKQLSTGLSIRLRGEGVSRSRPLARSGSSGCRLVREQVDGWLPELVRMVRCRQGPWQAGGSQGGA